MFLEYPIIFKIYAMLQLMNKYSHISNWNTWYLHDYFFFSLYKAFHWHWNEWTGLDKNYIFSFIPLILYEVASTEISESAINIHQTKLFLQIGKSGC